MDIGSTVRAGALMRHDGTRRKSEHSTYGKGNLWHQKYNIPEDFIEIIRYRAIDNKKKYM